MISIISEPRIDEANCQYAVLFVSVDFSFFISFSNGNGFQTGPWLLSVVSHFLFICSQYRFISTQNLYVDLSIYGLDELGQDHNAPLIVTRGALALGVKLRFPSGWVFDLSAS